MKREKAKRWALQRGEGTRATPPGVDQRRRVMPTMGMPMLPLAWRRRSSGLITHSQRRGRKRAGEPKEERGGVAAYREPTLHYSRQLLVG